MNVGLRSGIRSGLLSGLNPRTSEPEPEPSDPPTWAGSGTALAGPSTGTLSPAFYTNPAAGDIAVLVLIRNEGADHVLSDAQGFTEVPVVSPQNTPADSNLGVGMQVWTRTLTDGSPASPVIADSTTDAQKYGIIFGIRGASGIDVAAGDTGVTDTAIACPGVTTTANNCLVVHIVGNTTDTTGAQASGWANAALSSLTERVDINSAQGNGNGVAIVTGVLAAAGASGTTTGTLAIASVQARITLAFKP